MCDFVSGQLLLCHHKSDLWAQSLVEDISLQRVEHVSVIGDLTHRLECFHVKSTLPWNIVLLEVPAGHEAWKQNFLHSLYLLKSLDPQLANWFPPMLSTADLLQVVPNSKLSLSSFALSEHHPSYSTSLGPREGTGRGVRVAVVDSGLDSAHSWATRRLDLLTLTEGAPDRLGHGSAVATVIHAIAPDAQIEVVKITDSQDVTEWDALAGLHAAASSDVINLSWSFGLADRECPKCGYLSHSSRSSVFENVLTHATSQAHQPIVVAAAGNQALAELRYPARFGEAIAIGALDPTGEPASYSNRGALSATLDPHLQVYFAPGGDRNSPVGSLTAPFNPRPQFGTSLAAAYASGVVACARETHRDLPRATLLAKLAMRATRIDVSDSEQYGHGRIQAL